ncbi:DUF6290 family protein [Patescibacteria group bacterium AH-259-L07]|nr:DUF6290 family protein [Patescibacteria group bacterium AH-259-L07]
MSRVSKIFTISLPPKMAHIINKVAREENKTKSELIRAALLNYFEDKKRWQMIRSLGTKTAKELNIKDETDVEKLIDSIRS